MRQRHSRVCTNSAGTGTCSGVGGRFGFPLVIRNAPFCLSGAQHFLPSWRSPLAVVEFLFTVAREPGVREPHSIGSHPPDLADDVVANVADEAGVFFRLLQLLATLLRAPELLVRVTGLQDGFHYADGFHAGRSDKVLPATSLDGVIPEVGQSSLA